MLVSWIGMIVITAGRKRPTWELGSDLLIDHLKRPGGRAACSAREDWRWRNINLVIEVLADASQVQHRTIAGLDKIHK
jgi:hypothetical protein